MKRFLIVFALIVLLFGCDNRTTDPDDMLWAWVHVYDGGNMIYDEVLDETDNGYLVVLTLADSSQASLSKFVNIRYSELQEEEEEIARDYIILASRDDYYTRHYQCSYLDTMNIYIDGGFSPTPSGKVCGAVFTEDYYSIRNEAFHILQDTVIVCNFSTNIFGYFESDSLDTGNYGIVLQAEFPYGDTLSFNVDSFYKDYYLNFDGE